MEISDITNVGDNNPFEIQSKIADAFDFCLGAPSYVWKGGYAENVRFLSKAFNVIQLLVFEPFDNSYDIISEIDELLELKKNGLQYLLHLPLDSEFGNKNRNPVDIHLDVITKVKRVGISRYILHVEKGDSKYDSGLAYERVNQLLDDGGISAEDICVEYLNETFDEIWSGLEGTGVSICMDLGHVLYQGGDPVAVFDKYKDRIKVAHIHGVNGKDHRSLAGFPADTLKLIFERFENVGFKLPVIIENHSVPEMLESLRVIEQLFPERVNVKI